jgi:hypothetical protein
MGYDWRMDARNRQVKKQLAIDRLRKNFKMLGFPLDDLSDSDVEKGLIAFAEAHRAIGIENIDAVQGLTRLASAGLRCFPA